MAAPAVEEDSDAAVIFAFKETDDDLAVLIGYNSQSVMNDPRLESDLRIEVYDALRLYVGMGVGLKENSRLKILRSRIFKFL
jgi:uncharacterized protein YbaA (DUF1428 family)